MHLTKRQREIARGLLQGWQDKRIAAELGIAESTVGNHLRVVFARYGFHSRMQFAIRFYRETSGSVPRRRG